VVFNATVMALNAGMPVSAPALAEAGLRKSMDVARGDFYKHTAMTGHTTLAWLGDTVPFHFAHTVLSPGDLLMLAGIATVIWAATKQQGVLRVRLAKLASRTDQVPALTGDEVADRCPNEPGAPGPTTAKSSGFGDMHYRRSSVDC
jgi:hypothetical protein